MAEEQRSKGRRSGEMEENEISKIILDAAIAVHNELGGPGLLESYYENALKHELELRGLKVETQKPVPNLMTLLALL